MKTPNELLLDAVRSRVKKKTEFAYGILTADRFVKTVEQALGIQACYRHFCSNSGGLHTSYNDVLQKAAQTLVYGNSEMEIEEKTKDDYSKLSGQLDLPKDTLMVFRHVLTTSRKDRDEDVLRTGGFKVDPKMLLLWQHVHTMPIGKMLGVVSHDESKLVVISAIVDINDLCHDSAVMVDNGMGRFSHGFRATEFEDLGKSVSGGGYDVKKGEILEESLVSVPANVDAETQEVLLSLVEGGKLTSTVMKQYGERLRSDTPTRVPVTLDLKVVVNNQEVKSENQSGCEKESEGKSDDSSTPKEANAGASEGKERETGDNEVIGDKTQVGPPSEKFYGPISGSFEDLLERIRVTIVPHVKGLGLAEVNDWVFLEATFPDSLLVTVERQQSGDRTHYRFMWTIEENTLKFSEDYVLVTVSIDITKSNTRGEKKGRVLSTQNESRIRETVDDLKEAVGMDGLTRPCKALLNQSTSRLNQVLSSLGESKQVKQLVDKNQPGDISVKRAIGILFTKGDTDDFILVKLVLGVLEGNQADAILADKYSSLVT